MGKNDTLLILGAVAAGGLLLWKSGVFKGLGTASEGLGTGISTAGQGLGTGLGETGQAIGDIALNLSSATQPIGSLGEGTSNLINQLFDENRELRDAAFPYKITQTELKGAADVKKTENTTNEQIKRNVITQGAFTAVTDSFYNTAGGVLKLTPYYSLGKLGNYIYPSSSSKATNAAEKFNSGEWKKAVSPQKTAQLRGVISNITPTPMSTLIRIQNPTNNLKTLIARNKKLRK